MIRRRRSLGRHASDALVCHRLSCNFKCRRLKKKTGYRSFFLAVEQTARAISANAQCACLFSLQMKSIN
jgi:hypothetical protein